MMSKCRCGWVLLMLLLFIGPAAAKRGPAPVVYEGVRYEVPNDPPRMGVVAAYDAASGQEIWERRVYEVTEPDVQWVFIKEMTINKDTLIVTDERGRTYPLPLANAVPQESTPFEVDVHGDDGTLSSTVRCPDHRVCSEERLRRLEELKAEYARLVKLILPPLGTARQEVEDVYGKDFQYYGPEQKVKLRTPQYAYRVPADVSQEYFMSIVVDYDAQALVSWIGFPNPMAFMIGPDAILSDEEILLETLAGYERVVKRLQGIWAQYQDQLRQAPWNKTDAGRVGDQVTREGRAENHKLGAALLTDDQQLIWIEGLHEWPAGYFVPGGKSARVRVTGLLSEAYDLPVTSMMVPDEVVDMATMVQGYGVADPEDRQARHRYLLRDATWEPLDNDLLSGEN